MLERELVMVGKTSFDYSGESTIVTGSTRGIGRGIAAELADHDANVAIVAKTRSDIEETVDDLSTNGTGEVIGIPTNLSNSAEIEAMVTEVTDVFGQVDLLVNNAAVWPEEDSMVEASLETWDWTMAVNVRAQWYASMLVANRMIDDEIRGNIVNVTSQTGDRRTGGRGFYGVSNTAVNGLTWRMAHDLAEFGIRVNAISTDMTDTSQLRYEAEQIAANDPDRTADGVYEEWADSLPIGRLGTPRDLASAVLFLASDRAEYVVGTILRVSGGGNLQ